MKVIIAIIKPDRLEAVKQELYKAEVNLITVSEVLGHGRQMGVTEVYRGVKEMGNLLRKVQLLIAVNDDFVEKTVKAIVDGAKTGEIGDGIRAALGRMYPHKDGRAGREGHRVRGRGPPRRPPGPFLPSGGAWVTTGREILLVYGESCIYTPGCKFPRRFPGLATFEGRRCAGTVQGAERRGSARGAPI